MGHAEKLSPLFASQGSPRLPSSLQEPSPRLHIAFAVVASILWSVFAWIGVAQYADHLQRAALNEAEKDLAETMTDISTGLRRNLAVYHGIPAAIGRDRAVHDALLAAPPPMVGVASPQEKQSSWQGYPPYERLNRTLLSLTRDIPAFSAIWAMNAGGDCVAASNAGTRKSFVGVNYADRDYFKTAREGRQGAQFAVGRVTGVPGLFFSAPAMHDERFVGVIAVKIDLPFLATWVNQANAFITDPYGVIILAQDRSLEMHALPGATVHRLTPEQRSRRYREKEIAELSIRPWGDPPHATLKQLNNRNQPLLMAAQEIPGEVLTVNVMIPVPRIASLDADRAQWMLTLAGIGVFAIAVLSMSAYYVGNRRHARRYREQLAQIEYLATHDTLTGLFNRAMIEATITQSIALSARSGRRLAVLFVDLDRFKPINDSMGHEAGDYVLCEVAQRLRSGVRASDTIIRQGGDEFIVVLNDIESADDAARVARKLIDAVSCAYSVYETQLSLSASIGIAIYPQDGDTPSMLLRNADAALYHVKENGRADFHFYSSSMTTEALAQLSIDNDLHRALERHEFAVYYQPQFDLLSQRIIGCEALLRWRHPSAGLMLPEAFIPTAEKNGLIVPLDEWVLHQACRQMQEWRQRLGYDMHVSVNIATADFRKPGLAGRVRRALSDSGLPPECLELELTEGAMMEKTERAAETLNALNGLGVRLAIDGFGAGYSSLAYLKRINTHTLKIDRACLPDIEQNENIQAIIGAIVRLAKNIQCEVLMEGVETETHAKLLNRLGCTLAQGFWLTEPLPVDEFVAFIAAQTSALMSAKR